ncbi:hypothetical protein [Halomonas sp. HL-93]|uniref:hypothetical protein n=1 Tax=Halomonas sp. HL-93 TaxID=1666906 RepID=UPI0007F04FDA|nr:hypothetical protein [Halomonas sp. HL-93]SBR45142.1 hypothetical protein GA0071314_0092 [Halomonas sp. HL-93]
MLLFKEMSDERKKEVIEFIINNKNEKPEVIAKRFNLKTPKIKSLQRKHLKKASTYGF